jgi:hypothetical protein
LGMQRHVSRRLPRPYALCYNFCPRFWGKKVEADYP